MSITIQGKTFERLEGFTDWKEWVATEDSVCPPDAVGKQTAVILGADLQGVPRKSLEEGLVSMTWRWSDGGYVAANIVAYCTKLDEGEQPLENTEVAPIVDVVNHPPHYQLLPGVEVRDVIKVLVSKIADKGVLTEMQISDYVQMMQYLLRFMEKGGVEDIKKAKVYLEWILEDA